MAAALSCIVAFQNCGKGFQSASTENSVVLEVIGPGASINISEGQSLIAEIAVPVQNSEQNYTWTIDGGSANATADLQTVTGTVSVPAGGNIFNVTLAAYLQPTHKGMRTYGLTVTANGNAVSSSGENVIISESSLSGAAFPMIKYSTSATSTQTIVAVDLNSGAYAQTVQVTWATNDSLGGTAPPSGSPPWCRPNTNYVSGTGVLTFAPGATEQTFAISSLGAGGCAIGLLFSECRIDGNLANCQAIF